jgi:hypothetical protein
VTLRLIGMAKALDMSFGNRHRLSPSGRPDGSKSSPSAPDLTPQEAADQAAVSAHKCAPGLRSDGTEAMSEDLPFKIVRSNGTDEVLARAVNLLIARGAYREAARMYPEDLIELRQGARVIEKSK